jgi:hypothetical protein
MIVVILSMASYLLGFALGPKKQMFSPRVEWFFTDTPSVQVRFNLVVMVVFLVGIAAWMGTFAAAGGVRAHMQNIGSRNETIAMAGGILLHLTKWAYVGFFLYFARNGIRPTTIAMFGVLMLIYLAFGSRNWVGMFLAGTAIIYRMRFGKIPAPFWIGGVVALAFVQSFLVLLRNTSGDVGLAQYMYQRRIQTTEGFILSMVGDFAFLPFITDTTVSMGTVIPYQWGQTLLSFLYVIPRFIWKTHDHITAGSDLYMQHLTPESIKFVSVGPSIVGEFVMNFGLFGAILLPLLLGVVMRWFSSATVMHPHRRYQVAFPVMAAIMGPEMLSLIKHGFIETAVFPYLLLPLVIPYLANLTYLTSGAPKPATAAA